MQVHAQIDRQVLLKSLATGTIQQEYLASDGWKNLKTVSDKIRKRTVIQKACRNFKFRNSKKLPSLKRIILH